MTLKQTVAHLRALQRRTNKQIDKLKSQSKQLEEAVSLLTPNYTQRKGRRISAAGRARIARAQRLRWAKQKKAKVIEMKRKAG